MGRRDGDMQGIARAIGGYYLRRNQRLGYRLGIDGNQDAWNTGNGFKARLGGQWIAVSNFPDHQRRHKNLIRRPAKLPPLNCDRLVTGDNDIAAGP